MVLWIVGSGREDQRAEYARAHSVAVVGWGLIGDLTDARAGPAIGHLLSAVYPGAPPSAIATAAEQLRSFVDEVTDGDMLAIPLKRSDDVWFARVTGGYRFDPSAPIDLRHQRPVEWLRRVPRARLDADLQAQLDTQRALTRAGSGAATADALADDGGRRGLSRRVFLVGGAAVVAGAGAAVAAIFRPWETSKSAAAPRQPVVPSSTTTSTVPPVSPSPNGPVANWVVAENTKPGTSAWNVFNAGRTNDIEGYANVVSAQIGETVDLYVSTTAPTFHVEVYRLGWYQGLGGRLIWQGPEVPGAKQAAATLAPSIYMTEAGWQRSAQVVVDATYPPGVYFLKLVGSTGVQRLVPLLVRDDASTAAYAVQCSVTTWQAYNEWGGYSLYNGPRTNYDRRSRVVSFDRPYAQGLGQADFLGNEFPFVQLIEQLGLDVTYITNVDTHARPQLLTNHKAFFSLGHDEYWSKEMRDGVEGARDAGVNLAFLGANASYRQVRFEPSALGPNRHMVCYKSPDEDPIRKTDPTLATGNWRAAPVSRPESLMIGQQYESHPARADMVIVDPTAWVFTSLLVGAGQHIPIAVGNEYDRYDPRGEGPTDVQILAHSPLTVKGAKTYSDMIYWTAPSGAGIFSTGSIFWISKLTPPGPGSPFDPVVTQVMKNVLAAFGTGPAGQLHPVVPNYDAIARQYGATTQRPSAGD